MAIPWLKNKSKMQDGIAVQYRQPDHPEDKSEDEHGLEAGAQDLIQAIHSKDKKLVLAAIRSLFEILDSLPHEEGEHIESKEE